MYSSSDVSGSVSDCGERHDGSSQTQQTGGETAEHLPAEACCYSQVLTARVHQVHLLHRQLTTRLARRAETQKNRKSGNR